MVGGAKQQYFKGTIYKSPPNGVVWFSEFKLWNWKKYYKYFMTSSRVIILQISLQSCFNQFGIYPGFFPKIVFSKDHKHKPFTRQAAHCRIYNQARSKKRPENDKCNTSLAFTAFLIGMQCTYPDEKLTIPYSFQPH